MAARDELEILWSDADAVAVMKPAGLATIPGRGETDSVLERLAGQLGLPWTGTADPRLRVVHRLDKETSGVLLFARQVEMQRHLSHQFQHNDVAKEYVALVRGLPPGTEGVVDAPLARHPTNPKKMAIVRHGGRPARTEWRVEEAFRDVALVRCFPKTGKTHQIRVHLESVGMPIVNDPIYNPVRAPARGGVYLSDFKRGYRPTPGETERPLIDRLALHAHRLRFADRAGTVVEVEAPLPKDLRVVLNNLRKYAQR